MTRRVVLLRHAKSAWPAGVPDHDRPLAGKGRRNARAAGDWLRREGPPIDLVLCSDALRARHTWEIAGAVLAQLPALRVLPALYGAEPHDRVYGVDASSDSLELALTKAALRAQLPLLAICRGMQVLNVALGGTLDQHLTGRPGLIDHGQPGAGKALHEVVVESGSLLAKTQGGASSIADCWSYHHQAIDRFATCEEWRDLLQEAGLRVRAVERWDKGKLWKRLLPFHLAYHFLFLASG